MWMQYGVWIPVILYQWVQRIVTCGHALRIYIFLATTVYPTDTLTHKSPYLAECQLLNIRYANMICVEYMCMPIVTKWAGNWSDLASSVVVRCCGLCSFLVLLGSEALEVFWCEWSPLHSQTPQRHYKGVCNIICQIKLSFTLLPSS